MSKPIIALVGRPNVGKSTLFNRLSVRKKAIVHDKPGVTRDRQYADAKLGPLDFIIIDTPGLEDAKPGELEHNMTEQSISAVKNADLVILVLDGSVGCTSIDKNFANLIRKHNANNILVLNKCEKPIYEDGEYFKLGMGAPVKISAEHGTGLAWLCDELLEKLGSFEAEEKDPFTSDMIQIAIVGRPNAGKSTFINALLDENRLLTGPMPGITRDSIDIDWEYKGKPIKLVDTAGLRKKGNIIESIEKMSAASALKSIRYANTVVLMLDATIALEHQDLNIASLIINEGRSLVIALNKWDLIEDKKAYKDNLEHMLTLNLAQVSGVPCVYLSSTNKTNIHDVIDACIKIYSIWNKRITTNKLNDWLAFALEAHQLPLQKNGRRVRIKYCTQIKTRPPTFKFFTNYPDKIPDSYLKYLINDMRKNFKLPGVPIRISFVKSDNPYAKNSSNKKR
jgi:GTP-binding protein